MFWRPGRAKKQNPGAGDGKVRKYEKYEKKTLIVVKPKDEKHTKIR